MTPWTVAHQASLSTRFSRQEYWSGLPFPSPGDLPDPGIKPRSPALQADSLPSEPSGKPHKHEEKMNYSGITKCFQYEKHDVCHKQRALTSGEAISSRHRWTFKKKTKALFSCKYSIIKEAAGNIKYKQNIFHEESADFIKLINYYNRVYKIKLMQNQTRDYRMWLLGSSGGKDLTDFCRALDLGDF